MILLTISDGTLTKQLVDTNSKKSSKSSGYNDGTFYIPDIDNLTSLSFSARPIGIMQTASVKIDIETAKLFDGNELTASVEIWDEVNPKISVFSGLAILIQKNRDAFTYSLRNEKTLQTDLLSIAPDLKTIDSETSTYSDGRVYPMTFGRVKFITPLILALSCVSGCGNALYSDGETLGVYDGGLSTNFTQATSTVKRDTTQPVYPLTQDINGGSTGTGSVTTDDEVTQVTKIATDGDDNTADFLITHGYKIISQAGVGDTTRHGYSLDVDGQSHWYDYNTGTSQWDEILNIGRSTVGSDFYAIDITGTESGINIDTTGSVGINVTNPNTAIQGSTINGTSVYGVATGVGGTGVYGQSDSFIGVRALSNTGTPLSIAGNSTKGHYQLNTGITSDPSSPSEGMVYYNSSTKKFRGYNGTTWTDFN